ncbi:MAG: hypothetical protein ACRDKT_01280 [Actinomycetota bacterium]
MRRYVVFIVAMVVTSALPPASSQAAQQQTTLILTGTRSSVAFINLEDEVSLRVVGPNRGPRNPSPDISVDGHGAFVGAAIIERPYKRLARTGRFLIAGRFSGCPDDPCPYRPVNAVLAPGTGSTRKLKPGSYAVYLITDGSPVRIELRFDGGPGGILSPSLRATDDVDVKFPETRMSVFSGPSAWSAGSTYRGGQIGLALSMLLVHAKEPLRSGRFGICGYNSAPPEHAAYGPHCSAATAAAGSGWQGEISSSGNTFGRIFGFSYHEQSAVPNLDGTRGLGFWIESPQLIEHAAAAAFFLDLSAIAE